jgi:ABC-type enterochelin transport system permease subunit
MLVIAVFLVYVLTSIVMYIAFNDFLCGWFGLSDQYFTYGFSCDTRVMVISWIASVLWPLTLAIVIPLMFIGFIGSLISGD